MYIFGCKENYYSRIILKKSLWKKIFFFLFPFFIHSFFFFFFFFFDDYFIIFSELFFIFFLPMYAREKIVFRKIFSKFRIWFIYTFWGLRNPNITFLMISLYGICVCVFFICITQKLIVAETLNLVFYICIIYRCYLKLFMNIGQMICVQRHTKHSNTLSSINAIPN